MKAKAKPERDPRVVLPSTAVPASARRPVTIHHAHPRLRLDRRAVAAMIHQLDRAASSFRGGPPPGELSLAFLTDAALAQVHQDFLQDPGITDVITFEGDPAFGTAGEICVSADTAQTFVEEHDGDFSRELTLYLVHGWLHLAGYDDVVPAKKREMRRAETRAMQWLETHDALPTFSLRPWTSAKTPRR
jgi:probable rRNA maturation factor